MCGRLSDPSLSGEVQVFPYNSWRQEFPQCRQLGISSIEWLLDYSQYNENPIFRKDQREEIKDLIKRHDVAINSLMAHYFIKNKLFGASKEEIQQRCQILFSLMETCSDIGVRIIDIPLLEGSELKLQEDKNEFVALIKKDIIPLLERHNITLGLETSLPVEDLMAFLSEINHSLVGATFDTGNSAYWGQDPHEQIMLLSSRIVNVHIKDRKLSGESIPLGEGKVDFRRVFSALEEVGYKGDYILETYMGEKNRAVTAKRYLDFLYPLMEKSYV